MGDAAAAKPIRRPNGKLYRPRKKILVAKAWENSWDDGKGLIVFGTLDAAVAQSFADEMCRYWYDNEYVGTDPKPGWYRDGFANGEPAWISDPDRGRPGVSFTADAPSQGGDPR